MITVTLAGFWQGVFAFFFIVFALFLCLIVLIQKPKGGGLAGAFGGAGGGTQMFGGKSGDFFTWLTAITFALFILTTVALVLLTKNDAMAGLSSALPEEKTQQKEPEKKPETESKPSDGTVKPEPKTEEKKDEPKAEGESPKPPAEEKPAEPKPEQPK